MAQRQLLHRLLAAVLVVLPLVCQRVGGEPLLRLPLLRVVARHPHRPLLHLP